MKNKFLVSILIVFLFFVFIALILTPLQKKPPVPVKRLPVYRGSIAIVIDDWGYHLDNLAIARGIKQPLTCAVLPNLKNSALVSGILKDLGFEIILHLPMQPKEKYGLEKDTITLNMDAKRVRDIVNKDLASVAFAKGVSNHMGSAITENEKMSSIVMGEVKKHKLYFLDSFVTAKSVCQRVAKKINLKIAKRDVFLDNENNPAYIRAQLIKLKKISSKKGIAVGIGHDRKATLEVLKEMLPEMAEEGYKFVFVSEIVN
ncbi:MAG: divergent polysaccharide deacetylase family protein [Candidatus Omnitrophica bacterium]|nr:divergent polysaccharide deacetylase family protein [Candidatus Omnitrophota bacterium]